VVWADDDAGRTSPLFPVIGVLADDRPFRSVHIAELVVADQDGGLPGARKGSDAVVVPRHRHARGERRAHLGDDAILEATRQIDETARIGTGMTVAGLAARERQCIGSAQDECRDAEASRTEKASPANGPVPVVARAHDIPP